MSAEILPPWKGEPDGITSVLSSAACEWFLMFLLFVDATFSYLITKFARYCELEPPCLLCTRLEHGLGKKKPGFYWSLLCSDHKEEITSLACCSIHGKTANVHSMCDECLTSTTKQNMTCSCCSEKLTDKSMGNSNIRPPLHRTPNAIRFCHKDSLKRVRDKFTGPMTNQSAWRNSAAVGTMTNVAYTKLKLNSDSDSEIALSEDDDDDDGNTEEHQSLNKPPSDGDALEIQADHGPEMKSLPLDCPNVLDLRKHKNTDPLSSDVAVGVLQETSESTVSLPHMPAISVLSEILSVCSVPSLPGITTPKNQTSAGIHCDEACLPEKNEMRHVEASIHVGKTLEQSDRNALKPIKTSGSAKIVDVKEASTSASDLLSKGSSHRAHHKHDESRKDKDSCPRVHPVSVSSESKTYASSDEITASGEDNVDQQEGKIEIDQNSLSALYKELEEERNASAIAAEEAMAMITRLQEEKAALRMEALHYLRMMEEQAAYDSQALERANDLLAEREKELQDLEYELESYRGNFPCEPEEDETQETSDQENQASAHTEMSPGASTNSES